MIWFLFLLAPGASGRAKSRRHTRRHHALNAISTTSFPRTQEFPIFNPAYFPYLQASQMLESQSGRQQSQMLQRSQRRGRGRSQKRSAKRSQTKENKRVYAPAAVPVVAIPAEELRIDGLPAGMDHVVIHRPEVPAILTPTPSPTPTPLPSGAPRWLYRRRERTPTPTPYPVGIALGMIPVPRGDE